jgi:hypothetical protein
MGGFVIEPSKPTKSDDKYVEKVFNWSEVNLSEMTCYTIHTLGTPVSRVPKRFARLAQLG